MRLAALAHAAPGHGRPRSRAMAMSRLPRRTACRAASLTRLARSAPLMPGRAAGHDARGRRRAPCACPCSAPAGSAAAPRGRAAARRSGGRSGPGRSRAGSRMSGRLVAAIMTTPSVVSKPSISESIWLRVCSRSSWPPPRPAPRLRPMESISSTKMMAGACLRAVWNRSRTRLAPTPDEHLHEVRAAHRHEGHAGLAGHGPGEQGLAGARAGRPAGRPWGSWRRSP